MAEQERTGKNADVGESQATWKKKCTVGELIVKSHRERKGHEGDEERWENKWKTWKIRLESRRKCVLGKVPPIPCSWSLQMAVQTELNYLLVQYWIKLATFTVTVTVDQIFTIYNDFTFTM